MPTARPAWSPPATTRSSGRRPTPRPTAASCSFHCSPRPLPSLLEFKMTPQVITSSSTYKNHRDYVCSPGGGSDAAHSCIGMPISTAASSYLVGTLGAAERCPGAADRSPSPWWFLTVPDSAVDRSQRLLDR